MSFFSMLVGLKKGTAFDAASVARLTGTHEQQLRAAYDMGYRDGRLDAVVYTVAAGRSKRWPPDPPTPPTSGGCALAAS